MRDPIKVGIMMPRYGLVHPASVFGVYNSRATDEDRIDIACVTNTSSSLLTLTFNGQLAQYLDMRDRGELTHIAMIHSDIQPESGWLSKLWRIMKEKKADLVSVVSPIKDTPAFGRTSTAIGSVSDPWLPRKYVMLSERDALPATFSTADVTDSPDELLLINTALWLADLRKPWWNKPPEGCEGDCFSFQFFNKITKENGSYVATTRPEDWELSRHMHLNSARYFATWDVKLIHHGESEWKNH